MTTQKQALCIAAQAGIPTLIWGKPGTGKTSYIQKIAAAAGRHLETVIASIRDPSDFAGLPIVVGSGVEFAPPSWAQRLVAAAEKGVGGVLFLDELSTAPPAVQAALLRVTFEGIVGDLSLPPSVWIIAAANPTDTTSGTWALGAALANRFVHIMWDANHREWVEGIVTDWEKDENIVLLPENWRDKLPRMRALVASFIKARPALLLQLPEDTESAGRAWASPRTWDMVTILLTACDSVNADTETQLTLVAGAVGHGAATEFIAWLDALDLPDPDALLRSPESFKVPERDDQLYAILSSVVAAAQENLTQARWEAAWKILAAASDKRADIAVVPASTLLKSRPHDFALPTDLRTFLPILKEAGLL